MDEPKILRPARACARYGQGRSTWYALAARGLLPKPIKLSARASGWLVAELDAVFAARAAGADDEVIRRLVGDLHAQRQKAGALAMTGAA